MSDFPFRFFNFLFFAALLAGMSACKKELPVQPPPTQPYQSKMALSLEVASCTGAALKLSMTDTARVQNWELRRDGVKISTGNLFASDTALLDLALAPSRSYNYRAYRLNKNTVVDSSAIVQVMTMDTTSDSYGFEFSYFGQGQFLDVFAMSDTEAYAVGDIRMPDPSGKFNDAYNGARWDGDKWTLIKIPVLAFCDKMTTIPATLNYCFGVSPNHFLFSAGGQIIRFDGSSYKYDCNKLPIQVASKMWGTMNSQYFVGAKGGIAHWDGTKYDVLASSAQIDLEDIWGNEHEVWAVGGESNIDAGIVLVVRNKLVSEVDALSNNGTTSVHSIWCDNRSESDYGFVALSGHGIKYHDMVWKSPPDAVLGGGIWSSSLFFSGIRGRDRNDVFAVGDFGNVVHFNGRSWMRYPELFQYPGSRALSRVSVSQNYVFFVGYENGVALIITGKKM